MNRQTTILPQGDVNCLWISGGLRRNWCHCDWRFSSLLKSWPVRRGNKIGVLERRVAVLIRSRPLLSFLYPRYPQWWGSFQYLVPSLLHEINFCFYLLFKKKNFQTWKILLCVFTIYLIIAASESYKEEKIYFVSMKMDAKKISCQGCLLFVQRRSIKLGRM